MGKFLLEIAAKLAADYGKSDRYTMAQVKATVNNLGHDSRHESIAVEIHCDPQEILATTTITKYRQMAIYGVVGDERPSWGSTDGTWQLSIRLYAWRHENAPILQKNTELQLPQNTGNRQLVIGYLSELTPYQVLKTTGWRLEQSNVFRIADHIILIHQDEQLTQLPPRYAGNRPCAVSAMDNRINYRRYKTAAHYDRF